MQENRYTAAKEIRSFMDIIEEIATFKEEEILNEACGVGAFPYKKVIEEIVDSTCSDFLSTIFNMRYKGTYESGKKYRFEAYKYLTSEIDFVNNLTIMFVFQENGYKDNKDTFVSQDDENQLVNGKLDKALISIYCNYDPNTFYPYKRMAYEALYHELNHAYEVYCQLTNMQSTKTYYQDLPDFNSKSTGGITAENIKQNCFSKNTIDIDFKSEYLRKCCYVLFSNTELNALISGIYGEMQGLIKDCGINLETCSEWLKTSHNYSEIVSELITYTDSYSVYYTLKVGYSRFFEYLTNDEANKIVSYLNSFCIRLSTRNNPINTLQTIIRNRLNKLYYGICKTASFALSEKVDIEESANISTKITYPMEYICGEGYEERQRNKLSEFFDKYNKFLN